jgi:hypothetical protein
MNTDNRITLQNLDRANFRTPQYSPEVNALCRRLDKMNPEDPKGVVLVSAKVAVSNVTLGQVTKLMNAEVNSRTQVNMFGDITHEEHFLEIKVGEAVVEVYCVIPE